MMGTKEKPGKEHSNEVYAKEITLKLVTGMRLAAQHSEVQNLLSNSYFCSEKVKKN
jgi:hypothetical protein